MRLFCYFLLANKLHLKTINEIVHIDFQRKDIYSCVSWLSIAISFYINLY